MTKILLDDALRSKLNGLDEQVELCDETGRTVGHYLPDVVYKRLLYSAMEIPYTEDDIERSFQEPGGRPLAEIWKSLGRS